MSYILDALRRADAERERGAVPSLQSQQHTLIDEDEVPARSRRLLWVAIALAIALAAALAWNLFGNAPSARPIAEGSVAPPAAALVAAPVAVAPTLTVPAPASDNTPPAGTAPTTPAAARAPVATTTAETRRAARRAAVDATAPTQAQAPPTAPPPATRAEGRIYAQAELPEDIRRDLPKVAINGSSYSGDAASRMVMINGQIFHEGDKLGGGLVLDKINRRSAVLSFKGYRYEIMF
jgi:general secretion pathway protein B